VKLKLDQIPLPIPCPILHLETEQWSHKLRYSPPEPHKEQIQTSQPYEKQDSKQTSPSKTHHCQKPKIQSLQKDLNSHLLQEVLNISYIAELCSDDWGLWRSVTDNLRKITELLEAGRCEAVIDKPNVLGKLTSIRRLIDTQQKTLRWKLRSQVGEKVQWYLDVEE
jgi:hypothetical protein